MKVAVCDDNKAMLDFLVQKVTNCFANNSIVCEIEQFLSGEEFASKHEKIPFDVVFLDIKMPDIDGFEAAKRIRKISEKTHIIFVTTEISLVYDSFDYHPFYFIPKGNPGILKAKLKNAIGKLIDQFNENRIICFELPHGEKKYIGSDSIIYVTSKSNYLDIVCGDETVHIRRKLNDMIEELPKKHSREFITDLLIKVNP